MDDGSPNPHFSGIPRPPNSQKRLVDFGYENGVSKTSVYGTEKVLVLTNQKKQFFLAYSLLRKYDFIRSSLS